MIVGAGGTPGPNVLVVTLNLLFPEHDGASLHLLSILSGLVDLGCAVDYYAMKPAHLATYSGSMEDAARQLTQLRIRILPKDEDAFNRHLATSGQDYDLVLLWPENVAMHFFTRVREAATRALLVFNTIDLAHIRLFRKARLTSNLLAMQGAIQAKRREVWLAKHADCTLVVSTAERDALRHLCPESDIRVVPSVIPPLSVAPQLLADREGLLFVGSFPYHANGDAVTYFAESILPQVRQTLQDVTFHVVGVAPPPEIQALHDGKTIVMGEVADIGAYFGQSRVFIAPLRYGAGIKTKILSSMSSGLPVVTTSIGAEGMHLENGVNALLADNPAEFATAVVRLYKDEALWLRIAANARATVDAYFSKKALQKMLSDLLQVAIKRNERQ